MNTKLLNIDKVSDKVSDKERKINSIPNSKMPRLHGPVTPQWSVEHFPGI